MQLPEALHIVGEGIILSSIKVAENRSGYILRLYESLGKETSIGISITGKLKNCLSCSSNLLEDELELLEMMDGAIRLTFMPFEIKTVLLRADSQIPSLEASFDAMPFSG
jgi:alpha-mannosidase